MKLLCSKERDRECVLRKENESDFPPPPSLFDYYMRDVKTGFFVSFATLKKKKKFLCARVRLTYSWIFLKF